MRPVEQTSTSPAATPSAAAAASAVRCVTWKPSGPVKQFAPPEFSTIAATWRVGDDLLRPEDRVGLRTVRREHRRCRVRRAAVHDEGEIERAGALDAGGDAGGLEAGWRGDGHGATPFTGRPVDSARPSAMFADWMAAPAVPFTRLSTAVTTTTRPATSSTARPMSAVFAPSTSAVRGNWPVGQQLHEQLAGVGVLPGVAHRRGIRAGHDAGRRRREDAARHRHDDGRERDGRLRGARPAQRLRDLGDVPVHAAHRVRVRRTEDLAAEQVRLQALAGARRADGEHRDEVAVLDDARTDAGGERERDGRRVASGCGDATRLR